LVVGGGECNLGTVGDPTAAASTFLNIGGHRVPIYVVAIAPPADSVAQLKAIATNSGGQYFEITPAMIDSALNSPVRTACASTPVQPCSVAPAVTATSKLVTVPEMVKAVNTAIQHAFASSTD